MLGDTPAPATADNRELWARVAERVNGMFGAALNTHRASIGLGTAHAPGTPTTDSLTSALERTLQPDVAARARSIATAVRSDGARAAAQRLVAAGPSCR